MSDHEDRLQVILFKHLNGKVTLWEALVAAYGVGLADLPDD